MTNKQTLKLTVTDFVSVNHYLAYRTVTTLYISGEAEGKISGAGCKRIY